jgi:hypothetical protein
MKKKEQKNPENNNKIEAPILLSSQTNSRVQKWDCKKQTL